MLLKTEKICPVDWCELNCVCVYARVSFKRSLRLIIVYCLRLNYYMLKSRNIFKRITDYAKATFLRLNFEKNFAHSLVFCLILRVAITSARRQTWAPPSCTDFRFWAEEARVTSPAPF